MWTRKADMTFREIRESKGIKATYVAKHLGISKQTFSAKETGKRKFNLQEVQMLCELYGVDFRSVTIS